jgi:hypothetical protein
MRRAFAIVVIVISATSCMVGEDQGPATGGGGGGGHGGGGAGGGGGGGTGGGGTSTVASVLTSMDHAECDAAFTCKASFPTNQGVTFQQVYGANAAACYTQLASDYYDETAVQSSINAGKITFDASAGADCISGFAAAPAPNCTDLWQNGPSFPGACGDALVGKVANGAACTNDFECSLSAYCDSTSLLCTAIQ